MLLLERLVGDRQGAGAVAKAEAPAAAAVILLSWARRQLSRRKLLDERRARFRLSLSLSPPPNENKFTRLSFSQ